MWAQSDLAPIPTTPPVVEPPPPPPFTEEQIQRNIARVGYLKDHEVIKLGLKYIEKINAKMDLSTREDLLTALVSVMTADTTQITTIDLNTQKLAAETLGHVKQMNKASESILGILQGPNPIIAETAAIEFSRTTKELPTPAIMAALKEKSLNETIREIALATADHDTIHYLVEVAKTERRYDPLYGLDSLEAVNEAILNYLDYFNAPAAPTNLVATLTTYNSIQLSWTDNSTNEQEFAIEVAVGDGFFSELARLPGNTIYYSHTGLLPEKLYKYRIRALNIQRDGSLSNDASVSTPPTPDPMPDPVPTAPELPASPKASLNLADLTRRMRVYIEGKPHADSVSALIQFVKRSTSSSAVEASRILLERFDRTAFDSSPEMTSLGLRAIDEVNLRSTNEFTNYTLPESLRREYGNVLRRNAATLQDRFVKDETPK